MFVLLTVSVDRRLDVLPIRRTGREGGRDYEMELGKGFVCRDREVCIGGAGGRSNKLREGPIKRRDRGRDLIAKESVVKKDCFSE